jgi:hypothetical protein
MKNRHDGHYFIEYKDESEDIHLYERATEYVPEIDDIDISDHVLDIIGELYVELLLKRKRAKIEPEILAELIRVAVLPLLKADEAKYNVITSLQLFSDGSCEVKRRHKEGGKSSYTYLHSTEAITYLIDANAK